MEITQHARYSCTCPGRPWTCPDHVRFVLRQRRGQTASGWHLAVRSRKKCDRKLISQLQSVQEDDGRRRVHAQHHHCPDRPLVRANCATTALTMTGRSAVCTTSTSPDRPVVDRRARVLDSGSCGRCSAGALIDDCARALPRGPSRCSPLSQSRHLGDDVTCRRTTLMRHADRRARRATWASIRRRAARRPSREARCTSARRQLDRRLRERT